VIGLLLAVPVAALIKIVLITYYAEPIAQDSRRGRFGVNSYSCLILALQQVWPSLSGTAACLSKEP
jgi:hypothetical protein